MNPKTNRRRGKASQRRVAEIVGGLNVGTLGGEDIYHEKFSIEVKSVSRSPIFKWFAQAEKNNIRGKTPCVIIHLKNTQHEKSDLIVFRLKDLLHLFNNNKEE